MLRPLRVEDVDELYALVEANRDHLRPWMPWADQDRDHTAEFVRGGVEDDAEGRGAHFTIVEDGRVVGVCDLHMIDGRNLVARIGYWVASAAQGRGLVTGSVGELLDHAFGELGLHRAEVDILPDNARSRAVAERLGFREEGVLREAHRARDGFRDLVLYAMLAPDWRARAS